MSIPSKSVVSIIPGVISAGSTALTLALLTLTQNPLMPFGKALTFANQAAVAAFFGSASDEAAVASTYFAGYTNSLAKPSQMTFAGYAAAAVAAWLQSASLLGMTLAQLQAIPAGTLTLTINGTSVTSSSINLSTVTSFSDAASKIQAAFTGTVPVVVWNAVQGVFRFTSPTTGANSSISYGTGAIATALSLTAATGATVSIGLAQDTPQTAMQRITTHRQNFATITTMFEFADADKDVFAQWASTQNSDYLGIVWDTNVQGTVSGSTACFGYRAKLAAYDGIIAISGDSNYAANNGLNFASIVRNAAFFFAGYAASLNYNTVNGRATAARRTQAGLQPAVTTQTAASTLTANGYSYVGQYANRTNDLFVQFNDGSLPGKWKWADNILNEIWMSNGLSNDLFTLISNVGAVNYNPTGYGQMRNALVSGTIKKALAFGAIRSNVALSSTQIEQVNTAAGQNVASIIQAQGFFLQILDPGPDARQARQTPIVNLWYTDGGAIQSITLNSFDIL